MYDFVRDYGTHSYLPLLKLKRETMLRTPLKPL